MIATSSKIVFVPTPAAINLLRKKYERPGIRCYLWGTYTRHIRSLNLPGGDILAEFARIAFAEVKNYPGGKIKIKVIETITEIEATAQEINASQTVGGRFASLFANALTPYRAYDEDEEDDDAERREE